MKFFKYAAAAALAATSVAHPVSTSDLEKRAHGSDGLPDDVILNFALTLEHLENVFYKTAIATFSYDAFIAAGFSPQFYYNLLYVASDEEDHVQALTATLQAANYTPVAACTCKHSPRLCSRFHL